MHNFDDFAMQTFLQIEKKKQQKLNSIARNYPFYRPIETI